MPSQNDLARFPRGFVAAPLPAGGHVHLIGICGVGMAALAGMLCERGYRVTGSDENVYPPTSCLVQRLGIRVYEGYRAENLASRPDLVVVGNAVSRSNPEAAALLESGLPYTSLPEALARLFLEGKRPVVVAGTHGKTTSTAMLGWVLEQAGRDPSLLVGGEALNFGGNYKLGTGPWFVLEGDEYDSAFFDKRPKFLHYRPQALLLTAVEFDHADIYRDVDHVKSAFRELIGCLPAGAPWFACADFPHAAELARDCGGRVELFGVCSGARWRAVEIADTGAETTFAISYRDAIEARAAIPQAGEINVRNALGVYALGRALGLRSEEIVSGMRTFRGVARRQELVGEFGGVALVDDFAHHPTAVAGAIAAVRARFPRRRLWAVFEPRSNTSRRRVFQREFAAALSAADRAIVSAVFHKETDRVAPSDQLSPQEVVREVAARGTPAWALEGAEAIAAFLERHARSGDVVLLMSNGSFGGLRVRLGEVLGSGAATRP